MADLRRLGKRGSYRLGRLGAPPAAPKSPPPPHYPAWSHRHRGSAILWLLACLAAAALIAAGALVGWWFPPFVAGLAGGVASRYGRWRLRAALLATIAITAVGWGAALLWLTLRGLPEGAVAREIAALAGLPPHAAVAVAATLLVAVIQGLVGLWLGRALGPRRGPR